MAGVRLGDLVVRYPRTVGLAFVLALAVATILVVAGVVALTFEVLADPI